MTRFRHALVGTAAIAAMVVSATPASARDRYDRHHDGIGAGEIIAGAVVLGGLAAILSSGSNRDRDYDRGQYGYENGGGSRAAVNQCVAAAERDASQYGRADVIQVRDIQRTRYGYRVTGTLRTDDNRRGYGNGGYQDRSYDGRGYEGRGYEGGYDRGDRYDYGRGGYGGNRDRGSFTCTIERGRVVDLDYRGL